MAGDRKGLVQSLANLLDWDPVVASGVAEAVADARTQQDVDDIVRDYMGGGAEATALVNRFRGAGKSPQRAKVPPGSQNRSARAPRGGLVDAQAQASTSQQQQQQGQPPAPQRKGERARGSLTVTHVAGKTSRAAPSEPSSSLPRREVANCLCCGKIYFTRQDTTDVLRFLEDGGICTFCGAQVDLSAGGSSQTRPAARERMQQAQASTSGCQVVSPAAEAEESAAAEEARAFKDRLVDYDRNAQQRTRVVDDQNDFFEIDTNAWLDPQERELLKQQEQALQEAEEARKKRVTFTIDLLGRQVLLEDSADPMDSAMAQANMEALLAAAKATGAEIPQGGGTATRAALRTASRIQPSPSLRAERPMFVPTTPETHTERSKRLGLESKPERVVKEPQGIVGGWGDEQRADPFSGSGMTAGDAARRKAVAASGSAASSSETGRPAESSQRNSAADLHQRGRGTGSALRREKRPQLRRLQHDDPFEAADLGALDDVRPNEGVVTS